MAHVFVTRVAQKDLTEHTASMFGLSHAVRTIPLGTAYAVWVGIGAALTVAWGVASGAESFSWAKVLLIAGLVACVVGLKLVGEGH